MKKIAISFFILVVILPTRLVEIFKIVCCFSCSFFRLNRFQLILYRYVLYRLSETFFLCASVFERNLAKRFFCVRLCLSGTLYFFDLNLSDFFFGVLFLFSFYFGLILCVFYYIGLVDSYCFV